MKCNQLRDSRGRQMSTWQVKQDLGFRPVHKWGKDEAWVKTASDGTSMLLLNAEDAVKHAGKGKRPHRLFAECKCCKKLIPAGRLDQHYRAH